MWTGGRTHTRRHLRGEGSHERLGRSHVGRRRCGCGPHPGAVRPVRHRFSPWVVAVAVLVVATLVTACVVLIPQVRFGYRSAGGHIAVETAAVLIALLVAMLAMGRLLRSAELADLLLTASFMLLAMVNLVFSAVPAVVSDLPNHAATWGAVGGRAVGAGLLATAAVAPARRLRPRWAVVWLPVHVGGGLLVAAGLAAGAG